MCKSIIADSFLAKLGRLTEYLPGVNEVVELVMELVVPKTTAGAACLINQPTSTGTAVCYWSTPYGGDNLVTPKLCNGQWIMGYKCFYYAAAYVNGVWKYKTPDNRACTLWKKYPNQCPACYGYSDSC